MKLIRRLDSVGIRRRGDRAHKDMLLDTKYFEQMKRLIEEIVAELRKRRNGENGDDPRGSRICFLGIELLTVQYWIPLTREIRHSSSHRFPHYAAASRFVIFLRS